MTPRRIEVEIGALVVDDPALARADMAAVLEREIGELVRAHGQPRASRIGDGSPRSPALAPRTPRSTLPAIAREIYERLGE